MFFSTAEIEVLRLAGWLKAIPISLCSFDTGMFSPAGISSLCLYKLLYHTQNRQYLKLTSAGWRTLNQLGYPYPKDSSYISAPQKLQRRNEAAKIMFTCYRAGINIFADTPEMLSNPSVYLSSIAARRNSHTIGSKVWAGCRVAGIARLGQTAYLLHFMDWQGMSFQNEMSLFHKLTSGRCEQTASIYAADSYLTAAKGILIEPPPEETVKRANGWYSFREAAKSTLLPLYLLECSETGAFQLAVMSLPDYRERLAHLALLEDYRPPQENLPDTDAFSASLQRPLLVVIDMEVKRLWCAVRTAHDLGYKRMMLLVLGEQEQAVTFLLEAMGLMTFAELFTLPEALFTEDLHLRLYQPPHTPYRTSEGGYLDAATLDLSRKAGGETEPQTGTNRRQKT